MKRPFFFGYGSLVNRATHDYPEAKPARLSGWRRVWRHTRLRDLAFLSVRKSPGTVIEGLIAAVPEGDWAALDERERAYERCALSIGELDVDPQAAIAPYIYCTRPENDAAPSVRHPVLLSYIDTVVLGYLNVFGQEGAARFFETTDGWDIPVLDDRSAPVYPRSVAPNPHERALIDAALDRLEVTRIKERP